MKMSRALTATATAALMLGSAVAPVSAQKGGNDSAPSPTLLTEMKMDWAKGSSEWVNFTWTGEAEFTNVKVEVVPQSKGFEVEYPTNQDGFSSLSVDSTLSKSEIDFTSVKISTEGSGTRQAHLYVTYDFDGNTYRTYKGRLQLTNKEYKGDDFAMLTDVASAVVGTDGSENWVEFKYKGLSPKTTNMKMSVNGLDVYYPQGDHTSLHHDGTLQGGETDVARIWIDPDTAVAGDYEADVSIDYVDFNGNNKQANHKVKFTIK